MSIEYIDQLIALGVICVFLIITSIILYNIGNKVFDDPDISDFTIGSRHPFSHELSSNPIDDGDYSDYSDYNDY